MKRLIPVISLMALCSCGGGSPDAPKEGARDTTPPPIERVVKPMSKEEVARERRAMGRWRTAAGVLPGSKNQWLILDVAGTKDARMEIRNSDLVQVSVTAIASGHVTMSATGIDISLPDAGGPLADFRSASASFPTSGTMLLKTANGRVFDMVYDGQ